MAQAAKKKSPFLIESASPERIKVWLVVKRISVEQIIMYAIVLPFLASIPVFGVCGMYIGFWGNEGNAALYTLFGYAMATIGLFIITLMGHLFYQSRFCPQYIEFDSTAGLVTIPGRAKGWKVNVPFQWIKEVRVENRIAQYGKSATHCWHLILYFQEGSAFVLHGKLSEEDAHFLAETLTALLEKAPRKKGQMLGLGCGIAHSITPEGQCYSWNPKSGIWRWVLLNSVAMLGIMGIMGFVASTVYWQKGVWIGVIVASVFFIGFIFIKYFQRKNTRYQLMLAANGAVFGKIAKPGAVATEVQTMAATDCTRIVLLPQRETQYDAGGVLFGNPESIMPTQQANFLVSNTLYSGHRHKLSDQIGILGLNFSDQPPLRALQIWVAARLAAEQLNWPIPQN